MIRLFSIFLVLAICTGATHAVKNVGGPGEIDFKDVWKNLGKTMAPLAQNPMVRKALDLHAQLPLVYFNSELVTDVVVAESTRAIVLNPSILYAEDGRPISVSKMVALALGALQTCESKLAGFHLHLLAEEALSYMHFQQVATFSGQDWHLSLKKEGLIQQLLLSTPDRSINLAEMLAAKLRVPAMSLNFDRFHVSTASESVMISGILFINEISRLGGVPRSVRYAITIMAVPQSASIDRIGMVLF
jgi:hypothetical protein